MSGVKWIKLSTSMFDNSKIKYLRTLPEGNSIVLIWVMLLAKAGKCNSHGFIFLTENIPYTSEMLGAEFGFDTNLINLALNSLAKLGLIQLEEQKIFITSWEEHQNIDGLEKIKEQTRKRVERHRNKKLIERSNVTSNVTVTQSNATDKDKEIDIDKNIYSRIIDYLNFRTNSNFKSTTAKTKKLIDSRLNEGFKEEDFKTVIDKKTKDWINNKDMCKYLRPETLFGTKFEGYLNEKFEEKQIEKRNSTYKEFKFDD